MFFLHIRQVTFSFIGCLLLGGCASGIQVFSYKTAKESSLASLASYCWSESNSALEAIEPLGGHPQLFNHTVIHAVDQILIEKGYLQTDCKQAAFEIDYRMGFHEDIAAEDASDNDSINNYGFKWSIGGGSEVQYEGLSKGQETIITIRHGTLHIAAFISGGELLWHASAEKTLNSRDSEEERVQTVGVATQKIMEHFPTHQP